MACTRAFQCTLLLALCLGCIVCRVAAEPAFKFAKPDYSIYHRIKHLFRAVHATTRQCKQFMYSEKHNLAHEGYATDMEIITVEPGGFSHDYSDKVRIMINFGEHGRELISSEIALALLNALCNSTDRRRILDRHGIQSDTVEAVLHHSVIKIIPMENVRGRELVEGGMLCERKNGRGVDPNRNWEVHWGHKEPDYDPSEEYPGKAPFSEPEAALLRAIAEEFSPHIWINMHSGMEALFVPYDHKEEIPEGPSMQATLKILRTINTNICRGTCAVGPGGQTVGYLAHGTATDHMHDRLKVGIPMTWEVYGDAVALFDDCFRLFNPMDAATYDIVVTKWTAAVFALLDMLPGHPTVPGLQHQVDMYKNSSQLFGELADESVLMYNEGITFPLGNNDALNNFDWQRGARHPTHYAMLGFACAVFAAFITLGKSRQAFSRLRGRFQRRRLVTTSSALEVPVIV